jgi:Xaa-Pro aminopeptidase
MLIDRTRRLQDLLETCGVEGLVFFDLANIRYFCGFTGTDGIFAAGVGTTCFLTDSRYLTQARFQVGAGEIREYKVKLDGLLQWVTEQKLTKVGFEAAKVPFATVARLRERAPGVDWLALETELEALRGHKDENEVAALVAAAQLNAAAFDEILPQIRPGLSERQLALDLEFALKRRGGEDKAFDFIVASGIRGALPHGVASDKTIQAGELVTIDFGVRWGSYHSDETVTLAVGEVDSRLRDIFDIVLAAHDRAIAAVRPGIPLKDIDGIARGYIASMGFADYFGHGLGHGVGLEVHEFPAVSQRSATIAEIGMVFTIEPGIYLPDLGGVRIEDMVEVTGDGCRRLTLIPKEFRSLPA